MRLQFSFWCEKKLVLDCKYVFEKKTKFQILMTSHYAEYPLLLYLTLIFWVLNISVSSISISILTFSFCCGSGFSEGQSNKTCPLDLTSSLTRHRLLDLKNQQIKQKTTKCNYCVASCIIEYDWIKFCIYVVCYFLHCN